MFRRTFFFMFLMVVLAASVALAAPGAPAGKGSGKGAVVGEVRYWTNPDYTRVAISVDREVEFEHHQLKQSPSSMVPSRIYIDIKGARLAKGLKDLPIGDGFLKTARVAQYRADVVRVVLDVDNIREFKIFPLSDPFRIIIDVKGERRAEIRKLDDSLKVLPPPVVPAAAEVPQPEVREQVAQPKESAPPAAEQKPVVKEPQKAPAREQKPAVKEQKQAAKEQKQATKQQSPLKPGKIRRIVVDPGHGGHDPGAVGAGGTMEKDIVLSVGLQVAEKIRNELGIDVVMTRSTDIFIPLEERTAIANKVNADLFVSVHANASLNRNAIGLETYYLNLAKTEKVAQLAARENNTTLEKVSVLQAILFDLMANYKLNDSAHLAEAVQKHTYKRLTGQFASCKNNGVKQGPFYVLVGATMPSILVETAFISNEREEKLLKDPKYQEALADGIIDGLRAYITSLH